VRGSPHQIFWWGSLLDYQLGVFLLCQWFELIFHLSHSVFSVFKRFSFFSVGKKSVENRMALGLGYSVGFE